MTPEERLMAFVEQEDTPRDNLDAEPQEEELEAEEPQEEELSAEEEATEEEAAEARILKLKYNGEEVEKPEEEVIALAQQGFDYTQKTQKLAEERKQIETQAQAIKAQEQEFQQRVQLQSAVLQEIAKVTAIDEQLAAFQGVNWNALSDSDPVEAQKLFFQYNQLQTQRGQLAQAVQQKQQAITQQQAYSIQRMIAEGDAKLKAEIPNWSPEVKKSLAATAKEYGFSEQEVSNLTDYRAVKLLHDAMQWRKLQAEAPVTQKKVASASPVVKAGSKDPKTATQSQIKKVRDELRRTGKSDYAAKLIERTL